MTPQKRHSEARTASVCMSLEQTWTHNYLYLMKVLLSRMGRCRILQEYFCYKCNDATSHIWIQPCGWLSNYSDRDCAWRARINRNQGSEHESENRHISQNKYLRHITWSHMVSWSSWPLLSSLLLSAQLFSHVATTHTSNSFMLEGWEIARMSGLKNFDASKCAVVSLMSLTTAQRHVEFVAVMKMITSSGSKRLNLWIRTASGLPRTPKG